MTQETEDVVALAVLKAAVAHGTNDRTWIAPEDAKHIGRAAIEASGLSDRIDVLEAELARAQCVHEWEWVGSRVEADCVTNQVTMRCSKCLITTTSTLRARSQNTPDSRGDGADANER